jgi:hypothetical protein
MASRVLGWIDMRRNRAAAAQTRPTGAVRAL